MVTIKNVADALRLLMKIGRDKGKPWALQNGAKKRLEWKNEAYDLLEVESGSDAMAEMFEAFQGFEQKDILTHLKAHYENSVVNQESRIVQAAALFIMIKTLNNAVPKNTRNSGNFEKSALVYKMIENDFTHKIPENSPVEMAARTIKVDLEKDAGTGYIPGILKPEISARSDSYMKSIAPKHVGFSEDNTEHRISMGPDSVYARQKYQEEPKASAEKGQAAQLGPKEITQVSCI